MIMIITDTFFRPNLKPPLASCNFRSYFGRFILGITGDNFLGTSGITGDSFFLSFNDISSSKCFSGFNVFADLTVDFVDDYIPSRLIYQ